MTYFTKPSILNRGETNQEDISYDTSLDLLLFLTSEVAKDCGLQSSNSLVVSILLEISKSGSLTFSVELRFSNIYKVSLWLSFELLSYQIIVKNLVII